MRHLFLNIAVAALLAIVAFGAEANNVYTPSNMDAVFNEPHPLADKMGTRWRPALPAGDTIIEQRRIGQGVRRAPAPVHGTMQPATGQTTATGTQQPAAARTDRQVGQFLSEIRIGALVHDRGLFSRHEETGIDANIEFLFASPQFLKIIWAPRPHIGVSTNTEGNTSQLYFGISYEFEFWRSWFAGFSLGGVIHDGDKAYGIRGGDSKELGCRALFRESLEFGYRFRGHHSLSAMIDHISNADICDKNEGLDNVGIRYGYRF